MGRPNEMISPISEVINLSQLKYLGKKNSSRAIQLRNTTNPKKNIELKAFLFTKFVLRIRCLNI